MNKTCQSLIIEEYKAKKADSMWPPIPLNMDQSLPVCGGTITGVVEMVDDGACGDPDCCWYPIYDISIKWTCSRCQHPFIENVTTQWAEDYLNTLIMKDLE